MWFNKYMNYKMVVTDIDNTLAEMYSTKLTDYCLETIDKLTELGIEFVPNTGRSLSALPNNLDTTKVRYAILGNGTCIYDLKNSKEIKTFYVNDNEVRPLADMAKSINALFMTFIDNKIYIDSKIDNLVLDEGIEETLKFYIVVDNLLDYIETNNLKVQKICIITTCENKEKYQKIISGQFDDLYISSFSDNSIELSSNKTDKGKALKYLCDYLKIDLKDVVASGDGENDYPMLSSVGYSITPNNAHDSVKKIANVVADNASEDGVSKAYRKLFNLD